MLKTGNPFVYLVIILLSGSCAVQVPPSGGAKDAAAPKVEKMIPENKTVRFDQNQVNIRFNEFILLNNPNEQVVISPPPEERPEYEVSGKNVKILLQGSLKRNTTYTINFGNAVTDNHEGNVVENLRYVFATGEVLDSNSISGTVLNSFTRKPEKSVSIGLYATTDYTDSTIYKQKPLYFTKSKDNGSFALENIPDQPFFLAAFTDDNKNLKYDKNEAFAFMAKPVIATDSLFKNTILWLFSPDPYRVNRLLDTFSRELGKYCFLVYRPTDISVKPVKDVKFFSWTVKGKNNVDSLFIYSQQLTNDTTAAFHVNDPDTAYDVVIKTRKKARLPAFDIAIDTKVELNDSLHINSSTPIDLIDTTRIIFKADTIRQKADLVIYPKANRFTLAYNWKETTKYTLEIKDSAVKDIYGQYSSKKRTDLVMRSLKDYSSLKLNFLLKPDGHSYRIQLMNDNESVIYKEFSLTAGEERLFEYLLPGTYRIKVIRDTNTNGLYDNGSLSPKKQPERVYYPAETITLKAYWDLEQTIDIDSLIKE